MAPVKVPRSLFYLALICLAQLSLKVSHTDASKAGDRTNANSDTTSPQKASTSSSKDLEPSDSMKSTKAVVVVTTSMLKDDKFSAIPITMPMLDLTPAAGEKKYMLVKKKPKMKKIKMEVYKPKMKYKKIKMKVPVKKMKKKKVKGYMVKKHHEHY